MFVKDVISWVDQKGCIMQIKDGPFRNYLCIYMSINWEAGPCN